MCAFVVSNFLHLRMCLVILLLAYLNLTSGRNISEEINYINTVQSFWEADVSDIAHKSDHYVRKHLLGAKISKKSILPLANDSSYINPKDIPKTFDARKHWPHCPSISTILDQGRCGSCWAMAATSCMTDRMCVSGFGKNIVISTANLMNCCKYCGKKCRSGYVDKAWHYFSKSGLVTGGNYHSYKGCQPYQIRPTSFSAKHKQKPQCDVCTNGLYSIPYDEDKHYGVKAYRLHKNVLKIQHEIMTNGPVASVFFLYRDFLKYKKGIYVRTTKKRVGVHAVRILGWGTEKGVDYWLAANSWGSKHFGVKGTFKIRRGTDECRFESFVIAGRVLK